MVALPSDVLKRIFGFLDRGLHWISCRSVCSAWHSTILILERHHVLMDDKHRETRVLIAPLQVEDALHWNRLLEDDFRHVRPSTPEERRGVGERFQLQWYSDEHLYRQLGPKWSVARNNRLGGEPLGTWRYDDPIVTAWVKLKVCSIQHMLHQKGKTLSPPFCFVGTWWQIRLSVEYHSFHVRLDELGFDAARSHPELKDPTRNERMNNVPPFVRYGVKISTGARWRTLYDFLNPYPWSIKQFVEPSCKSTQTGFTSAKFPLNILEFALGPPPACTDLLITVRLDFLGYGYWLPKPRDDQMLCTTHPYNEYSNAAYPTNFELN